MCLFLVYINDMIFTTDLYGFFLMQDGCANIY